MFLQLVPQQGSVLLFYTAHERLHGLCFVLIEGFFGVLQVVLEQCERGLSFNEHALDLDMWVSGVRVLLLGMLIDWHTLVLVFVFCGGLRRSSRCYAKRY